MFFFCCCFFLQFFYTSFSSVLGSIVQPFPHFLPLLAHDSGNPSLFSSPVYKLSLSLSPSLLFLFTSCLSQLGGTFFFVHVIRSFLAGFFFHSVSFVSLSVPTKSSATIASTHLPIDHLFAVPNNKPNLQKKSVWLSLIFFASLSTFGLYAAVATFSGGFFRPTLPRL